MNSADIALMITAIGGSVAAIVTAIAALRNANANAARMDALKERLGELEKENTYLKEHNTLQDNVALDREHLIIRLQHRIEQWTAWGDRIGRKMNQMELQIGAQMPPEKRDTKPLNPPENKDWLTGKLGPLDISSIKDDFNKP